MKSTLYLPFLCLLRESVSKISIVHLLETQNWVSHPVGCLVVVVLLVSILFCLVWEKGCKCKIHKQNHSETALSCKKKKTPLICQMNRFKLIIFKNTSRNCNSFLGKGIFKYFYFKTTISLGTELQNEA